MDVRSCCLNRRSVADYAEWIPGNCIAFAPLLGRRYFRCGGFSLARAIAPLHLIIFCSAIASTSDATFDFLYLFVSSYSFYQVHSYSSLQDSNQNKIKLNKNYFKNFSNLQFSFVFHLSPQMSVQNFNTQNENEN